MKGKIERKKRIRKISVLVVMGLFLALSLTSPVSATATLGEDDTFVIVEDPPVAGDGIITWEEDGTEYMRLTGGKLGIGTTSPDRKLEIIDDSNPQLRLTHTDGSYYTDFETISNGDLLIKPIGLRVGILTNSPQATLQVGDIIPTAPGSTDRIAIAPHNKPSLWIITARDDVVNAHLDLNYGFTTILTTRDDGNVGIGTTSPQNKLDVEGGAVIGATYSGTNTAPTNGLLVEGNVGIGTASPDTELHVNGDIKQKVTTSDVANPPTDAQLDFLFGTPASNGDGWTTYLKDSDTSNLYQIVAVGIEWYIFEATPAT